MSMPSPGARRHGNPSGGRSSVPIGLAGAVLVVLSLLTAGAPAAARAAGAAVDVNQASLADLEAVRGIGPALAGRIVSARASAPFADWADLTRRVRGLGPAAAMRLSAAGLAVGGRPNPAGAPSAGASTPVDGPR